jgi:hypothetical protein
MIQLNLMKAKASCYEEDRCTPKFIAEATAKVEQVYQLTHEIKFTMLSHKSEDEKHFDVLELTAKIMALTQGI